jgi:hypothetical protein
MGGLWFVLE